MRYEPESRIRTWIAGIEAEIVANPGEFRSVERCSERLRPARVELVITRHHVKRCNSIHEVHRIDHLLATPELALERRIEKVAAMQYANIPPLGLKRTHQRHDAAKAAALPIFHRADAIDIVEVDERDPALLLAGCRRRTCDDQQRNQENC